MKPIKEYKQPDRDYLYEGVTFRTALDFVGHLLDFCGCGCPDEAAKYVLSALEIVGELKDKVWEKAMPYEEWNAKKDDLFKSTGAEYFMWYYLDHKKYTEHGGGVPGWLTEKGIQMIENIKYALEVNEQEEQEKDW